MNEPNSTNQTLLGKPRLRLRSSAAALQRQRAVLIGLAMCAMITIITTFGAIAMLVYESSGFFLSDQISLRSFFGDTRWTIGQTQGEIRYGIWPLVSGTFRVTFIALLVACPIGLVSAIYLSEYAPRKVRNFLKPTIEILAGIPSVVLGFFAVTFITPFLLGSWGSFKPFNATSAGIAVGILCLPLVTSLVEDVLQAVPRTLREGAYGLGATRLEVVLRVILPAATSGIVSAFLLAFARAVGETMIVALAAGSTPVFTWDVREPSQTMTGFIVETINSESVVPGTLSYYSIYAVAAVLFLTTLSATALGQFIRTRFREVY